MTPSRFLGKLGYYFDSDLVGYLVRARYYDPLQGRFRSRDPVPENGVEFLHLFPDMTKYAYVKNNPVNQTDPSGADYTLPSALCLPCFATFTRCTAAAGRLYTGCIAGSILIPGALGLTCVGLCNALPHPVAKLVCRAACTLGNLGVAICYLNYICPNWLDQAEEKCINDYNRCKHADRTCRWMPDIRPS